MADERQRELQRQVSAGDVEAETKLLLERVRAGELTQAHVELAATLGHAAALELFPDAEAVEWTAPPPGAVLRPPLGGLTDVVAKAVELLGDETLPACVTADWAERVLSVFGRHREFMLRRA